MANNTSNLSTNLPITIVPVNVSTQLSLKLSSGSDTSGGRGVTSATSLTFDLTNVQPNAIVKLYRDNGIIAVATVQAGPTGLPTITDPSVPVGAHTYQVFQTVNGNTSPGRAIITVTVKTTATTPSLMLDPATDTGVKGDRKTSSRRPNFIGSADLGAALTLINAGNNAVLGTATADSKTGAYKVALSADLPDGVYVLQLQARDLAGNLAVQTLIVTITTTQGDFNGDGIADVGIYQPTTTSSISITSTIGRSRSARSTPPSASTRRASTRSHSPATSTATGFPTSPSTCRTGTCS